MVSDLHQPIAIASAPGHHVSTPPARTHQQFLTMLAQASVGHVLNGDSLSKVIQRHLEQNPHHEAVALRDVWAAVGGPSGDQADADALFRKIAQQQERIATLQAGVDTLVEEAIAASEQLKELQAALDAARADNERLSQAASPALPHAATKTPGTAAALTSPGSEQPVDQLRASHLALGDALMEISGWAESMSGATHWAVRSIQVALQSHAPDAIGRYLERLRQHDLSTDPTSHIDKTSTNRNPPIDLSDFLPFDAPRDDEATTSDVVDSVFDVSGVDIPPLSRQRGG